MEQQDLFDEHNKIAEESEKLDRAFYTIFHSPEGKIVLNDLLNQFYRRTSLTDDANPNMVLVNEGKRVVILYILARLESISKQPEE